MNEAANRGGMIVFVFCMAFSVVFFAYVMAFQPGPIDTIKYPPGGLTKDAFIKVRQDWATSTPEKIERGKKLFQVHLSFLVNESDVVAALNGDLKNKATEVGTFNFVTNGMLENVRGKFMYISDEDRWDIAHYLRSKVQGAPSSNKKELDSYLHYGL